jgi:hypothetical protein
MSPDPATPWVINSQGYIYVWSPSGWVEIRGSVPSCAKAIGVGRNNQAWVVGCTPVGNGNYQVFEWTGANWSGTDAAGTQIAVDEWGIPYVVTAQGEIWFQSNTRPFEGQWFQITGAPCATLIATGGRSGGSPTLITECRTGNVYQNYSNFGIGWKQIAGPAIAISVAGGDTGLRWLVAPNHDMCFRESHWKWMVRGQRAALNLLRTPSTETVQLG